MLLKLKAFIYRKTGKFLANSDLNKYLKSKQFKKDKDALLRNESWSFSDAEVRTMLTYRWRLTNKFTDDQPGNTKQS